MKDRSVMYDDKPFKSLHHFLLNSANNLHSPSEPYLYEKIKGEWISYTYHDILTKVDYFANWLMSQGLEKGDRVGMITDNCPNYYVIDQALQKLGLVNVSIYPTLTEDETKFIINDSGLRILLVGTPFLYKKFKKVEAECPDVFRVIHLNDELDLDDKFLYWPHVLNEGKKLAEEYADKVEARFDTVTKDDLATLIYTSGTTGVPKGAMLSHFNFMSNCYDAITLVPAINKDDLFLSFLPLSHVYERMATYYLTSYIGAQVAFSENLEKVAQNIGEIRPTIMACVPRLLERVHDKVIKNASDAGGIKKKIFFWALGVGTKVREAREAGKSIGLLDSIKFKIADKLVFSKINAKLGGRMRLFVSGGGALAPHVGEFFANLGFKVQEGYGLTETSPFVTINEWDRQLYGTVGHVAPSQWVAIQNIDTQEMICVQGYDEYSPTFNSEEGEILVKGPNIMLGYWQNKAETDNVFDADGWFHTGDIGRFDRGYLKITDRLKNMLKTSLGKNIYPTQIENALLKSTRIDQIFIIGDKREYLTAIIIPNHEEADETLGLKASFFAKADDIVANEDLRQWLEVDLKKYGKNLAKFERIKEFVIKSRPFTIETGEMTPKMSVKRKVVIEKYNDAIEGMYAKR
jgi:long-chain acyl-CoA synthetase